MEKVDKILLIINSLSIGGAEKLVVDIAKSNPDKYEVIALRSSSSFLEQTLLDSDVNYRYLSSGSVYNPLLVFKIMKYLRMYNVVHLHLFPTLYWIVFAKMLSFSNVKLIFTEHNTHNRRRESKFLQIIDKFIYKKLNYIITISESTENNLRHHLGFNNDNIKTITNGIDLSKFNLNNVKDNELKFFDDDAFILIQVSSFTSQKDQKTLINALSHLPQNIKLLLVGEGPLKVTHELYVEENNLSDRVKFLGIRNDVPELLSHSHISVLSSHFEGFGLVAVEGMAMGKPVIASDVPGLSEVVRGAGLLFEPGNSIDLAHKVNELYENQDFYQEVATNCLDRSKDFNVAEMIKKYENIYSKLSSL